MNLFTSDLHFSHKNIIVYTDRHKVVSEKDHDQWLIDIWNKQASPNDTVYHLGDFAFTKNEQRLENILRSLNGKIVMIRGNHDHSDNWKFYRTFTDVSVHDYKDITIGHTNTLLFHFPIVIWIKLLFVS